MFSLRFPRVLAATLLAAGATVPVAGPAGATPTPTPIPTPSATPSSTHPTDYPPTPSSSAPGPTDPATPPVAPTGPADLRITAVTTGSVALAWSPAVPGNHPIVRYDISYNQAFNDLYWMQSATPEATTATVVSGIRPTGQYSLRITAVDSSGLRSTGSSVSVVIPASDTAADRTPPSAPTGLTVASRGPDGATLTWTPSTDNVAVTGYVVYRFDGLYVSTPVATVSRPTATVPGTSGMQVYYVRAKDAAGNLSAVSNTIAAPVVTPTTPPAPTCSVTYRTSSQWADGFVADLKITNAAAAEMHGWMLTFTFGGDQRISNAWGATAEQSGANVSLTPVAWNAVIPAGGSVTVGMLGRWTTNDTPPASAQLNGFPCRMG